MPSARHEAFDLRARGRDPGLIDVRPELGADQRHEQADDGHHHQHFDQRDARLSTLSSASYSVSSFHIATSLMLVIASSMLKISEPTMMPITRITIGSKIAVKRLMAARVSFS